MNAELELIASISLATFLAIVVYVVLGLMVLDALERDARVARMTVWIDGATAWLLFLAWPLTAVWLFICARFTDRRRA